MVNFAHATNNAVAYTLVVPVLLAIICLTLAAMESAEIDRVGVYRQVGPGALSEDSDPLRAQVIALEKASQLANWTADRKLDGLLQARAWLSRGLVLLVVAGLVGLVTPLLSASPPTASDAVRRQGSAQLDVPAQLRALEDSKIPRRRDTRAGFDPLAANFRTKNAQPL